MCDHRRADDNNSNNNMLETELRTLQHSTSLQFCHTTRPTSPSSLGRRVISLFFRALDSPHSVRDVTKKRANYDDELGGVFSPESVADMLTRPATWVVGPLPRQVYSQPYNVSFCSVPALADLPGRTARRAGLLASCAEKLRRRKAGGLRRHAVEPGIDATDAGDEFPLWFPSVEHREPAHDFRNE